MSDDHPDQSPVDPSVDPPVDPTGDGNDHIRALLSELGSGPDGAPIPPAVADRLEDTLARLVAERDSDGLTEGTQAEVGTNGSVLPLRRRWLPRATAAAAAVVVLGAGGVAAASLGVFGGSETSSSSGSAAQDDTASGSDPEATNPSPTSGGKSLTRQGTAGTALPRVRGASFAADVASLLRHRAALVTPEGRTAAAPSPGAEPGALGSASCAGPGPDTSADRADEGAVRTPVRYDDQLAVVVVHPKRDGHQLVEAWTCDGSTRLAATTITP